MTIADKDTMEPLIIIRGILDSNMKGRLSGEAQITAAHPEAISIHSFCHSLKLAMQGCSEKLVMKNAMGSIQIYLNKISGLWVRSVT